MSSQLTDYFEVRNGYAFTSAEQLSEFESDTIEILKQGHIEIGGGLRKDPKKSYVRMSSKLERFMLERGDIVMAMTDMKDNVVILGVPALVDSSNKYVLNQRVAWLKPREKTVTKFFYYQMLTTEFLEELRSKANSGVQVNLSVSNIKEMKFWTPPLPEQQAIAEVLSSLDDKIDLLHRNNKTLEEMAETLFRQWFVEGAKEEWEVGTLENLIEVKYGKDHKNLCAGTIPVYGSGGLMRFCDSMIFNEGSVLIPRKGTLSNVMLVEHPFWTVDTMFYTKIKLQHSLKFIFHTIKNLDLESMNVGSAVPSMTTKTLYSIEVKIPPLGMLSNFEKQVTPFYQKRNSNLEQINKISMIRDTLLPKLMSGQVRVKN